MKIFVFKLQEPNRPLQATTTTMTRAIYRIVLSVCLATFVVAFLFQFRQLLSRPSIPTASPTANRVEIFPKDSNPTVETVQVESKFDGGDTNKIVTFAKGPEKPVKTGFLEGTRDYYDLGPNL